MIKIAIVDDHKIIADGLERLINESETVCVAGKAYSAAGCFKLLDDEEIEVLMLDIGLPDGNGIQMCPKIKEKYPDVKVIMLTSYGELATITRALDAGADGYVLKNSEPEELLESIHTVVSGEQFICDEANTTLQNKPNNPLELTRREFELLQLIVEGYTLPQLSEKMCLGIETIRSYRKNINAKLDVHNTAQLVQKAKELKLV